MIGRRTLTGFGVGIAVTAALWGLSTPAEAQLTAKEAKQVLACQEQIKEQGRGFIRTKLRNLEACADRLLAPQLRFENDLISQEQFDKETAKAQAKCEENFADILKASTTLVDNIVAKCEPVQALIFGPGDPLGFQGLISFIEQFTGPLGIDSAETLAGAICFGKEVLVDLSVIIEIPRAFELIDFFGDIPLDERCLAVLGMDNDG